MILLKRLTGSTLALNPDLMERVEANPDTVVTMVDGKKVLVQETVEEIVDAVLEYRAEILRVAYNDVPSMPADPTPALRLIVGPDESDALDEPNGPRGGGPSESGPKGSGLDNGLLNGGLVGRTDHRMGEQ